MITGATNWRAFLEGTIERDRVGRLTSDPWDLQMFAASDLSSKNTIKSCTFGTSLGL